MSGQQRLNILITTPSWQSALACIQSLGRLGHTVFVWSEIDFHPHLNSAFVSRRIEKKSKTIEDEVLELETVTETNLIDFVIPVSDHDALIGAKLNQKQHSNICLVGSVEAVSIARDRNKSAALCRNANLPFPKSAPATALTAEKVADEIGYPCFIKLSETVASQGVKKFNNSIEMNLYLNQLPQFLSFQIQKEVLGRFIGITGMSHDGILLDSFAFEVDYEHSHGGSPPYAYEIKDVKLTDILRSVAEQLSWTGGIDLDLLLDADGNYYILEINPRLSGTTVFPYKLGIDLPKYYIDIFNRNTVVRADELGREGDSRNVSRFVSILEELDYLRRSAGDELKFSRWFRRDDQWQDNSFWDDPGYSQSLFEATRQIMLSSNVALKRRALGATKS